MKRPRKSGVGRKSRVAVLRAPALARWPWLVHGFSTRPGGVSSLANSSGSEKRGADLNLGKVPWDRARNVEENRRRLLASLQAQEMRLVIPNQIHSDLIRIFDSAAPPTQALLSRGVGGQALRGDGLMTNQRGLLLSILAADCFPILLVDTRQRVVAGLHCGWRGTARRLAQKGAGLMRQRFGSREQDLRAAIGPGIRVCCYQVGHEVIEEFESQFLYANTLFVSHTDEASPLEMKYPLLFHRRPRSSPPRDKQRIHLDLIQANARQLLDAGIAPKHIYADAPCTSCHPELFFSHRRDAGRAGRMMAVIGIRES